MGFLILCVLLKSSATWLQCPHYLFFALFPVFSVFIYARRYSFLFSVCLSFDLHVCQSDLSLCLSVYQSVSVCLFVCLLSRLSVYLFACPSLSLFVCLSACLPVCLSVFSLPIWLFVCLSACLSTCLSACFYVCLSACLPVCLSIFSIFPSVYLPNRKQKAQVKSATRRGVWRVLFPVKDNSFGFQLLNS